MPTFLSHRPLPVPGASRPGAPTLAVSATGDGSEKADAEELARGLALPVMTTETDFDLLLVVTPERLELRDNRDPRLGPVWVDFSHFDLRPYSAHLSRRQPLARALGKKAQAVVDATAGYCQDALLFALMGYHTTAIERSPVVMALARDGLQRLAARAGIALEKHLHLVEGDARLLLTSLKPPPEVIYLDPMFPPKRKKSAAVKKEMRLLRELVGDDPDARELLEISRRVALDRVVVKRPDDAVPLAPDPSMSIAGKLVRYDVYLTRR
ncbi:MAG: class I SAM-dependent methyltransferase [Gammaproteobacteria bacterium]|nr:class I SAM-dependent methyltransferase [Gammaproteobacteria bacterium]